MRCPTCSGRVVSPEGQKGEIVCSLCGLVINKTSIAGQQNFTQWTPEWHSSWDETDSETMKEWLTILRTVSCQLNLPSFPYREEAARRIRKEKHALFRSQKFGKNKTATVAALLHIVLKQYDKNRSLREICKQLSLDSRLVMKQTWALNKPISNNPTQLVRTPRKTSTDYLFECGSRITNDTKLLFEAKEILMTVRRNGGNPIALAAGALYHTCKNKNLKVSKEQIAEAFGISHRTVYTNEAQIRALTQRSLQETHPALARKPELLAVHRKMR